MNYPFKTICCIISSPCHLCNLEYDKVELMTHFLGGRLVRVVWCEFKSESGHWKKAHLLLSTDAKLTPEQIIEAYGERWSIESMFNQLKLSSSVSSAS